MTQSLFRKEALEHKRERLWGDVLLFQPLSFSLLSAIITIIVGLIIALLFWGEYVRRETVQGYLMPSEGLSKVYAKRNGSVTKQYVTEGQLVKQGDKLLTISTGVALENIQDTDTAILAELEATKNAIEQKLKEETHLSQLEKSKLTQRVSNLKLEINQLDKQVQLLETKLENSRNKLAHIKKLHREGHLSQADYQTQNENYINAQLELSNAIRNRSNLNSSVKATELELLQLPVKLSSRLLDLQSSLSDIRTQIISIQSQRSYTLIAPIDGRVTALQIHEGMSATTTSPLLSILPEGATFNAELFVPTRAIGFVAPDSKVMIRYSAFPYQRYGIYQGKVERISEVILSPNELPVPINLNEPVYRVRVSLDQQTVQAYGQNMPLQAGMLLEADIILDQLTLIDWILDPLYSLKGRL